MATAHRDTDRDEAGFSLIELMVVTVLLTIVIVATLSTMWSIQRSEAYTRGRTAAMDNMRISLNRISKDLRQAGNFNATPTPKATCAATGSTRAPTPSRGRQSERPRP